MRKTTRDYDLEIIDQARKKAKTKKERIHREALLIKIYEMSKDPWLEKMRKLVHEKMLKMAKAQRKGSVQEQTQAFQELMTLKKKIEAYGQSETFRRNISRKIAKLSEKEAKLIFEKYE